MKNAEQCTKCSHRSFTLIHTSQLRYIQTCQPKAKVIVCQKLTSILGAGASHCSWKTVKTRAGRSFINVTPKKNWQEQTIKIYFMDFILNLSPFTPRLLQLFLCERRSYFLASAKLSWRRRGEREGRRRRGGEGGGENFHPVMHFIKKIPQEIGCYLQITTGLLVNG